MPYAIDSNRSDGSDLIESASRTRATTLGHMVENLYVARVFTCVNYLVAARRSTSEWIANVWYVGVKEPRSGATKRISEESRRDILRQ